MSVTETPSIAPEAYRPDGRLALIAMLVAAISFDVAVRAGVAALAGTVAVLLVSGFLLASGSVVNRQAQAAIAAAPVFGMWLAWRTSPWLVPLDVLVVGGLLVLGSSLAADGSVVDLRLGTLAKRAIHALAHGLAAPVFVGTALAPLVGRGGRHLAVVRGAILAAPVVLVILLLLSSADAVFASFFELPLDPASVAGHGLLLLVGGWGMAGLLWLAAAAPIVEHPDAPRRRPIGAVEATTVLSCLVAVFAAFAVSQLFALSGGGRRVIETAGLSYADYARGGFFQLLAVAAITLATLTGLRTGSDLARPRDGRRFVVLAGVAVALTLLIVCVALRRLHLYEQAFGLTMLRLYSTVFALWIAGVFVLLGVSLAGVGRRRPWLLSAATSLGLAGLLALNALNPEAVVVRHNVDAAERTGRFDADYLSRLSDDAVPALVGGLRRLPDDDRAAATAHLCATRPTERHGWWSFNASSDAAAEALDRLC